MNAGGKRRRTPGHSIAIHELGGHVPAESPERAKRERIRRVVSGTATTKDFAMMALDFEMQTQLVVWRS